MIAKTNDIVPTSADISLTWRRLKLLVSTFQAHSGESSRKGSVDTVKLKLDFASDVIDKPAESTRPRAGTWSSQTSKKEQELLKKVKDSTKKDRKQKRGQYSTVVCNPYQPLTCTILPCSSRYLLNLRNLEPSLPVIVIKCTKMFHSYLTCANNITFLLLRKYFRGISTNLHGHDYWFVITVSRKNSLYVIACYLSSSLESLSLLYIWKH